MLESDSRSQNSAARREVKLSGHLAACVLKAHGTATGEAWCRPALWSRTKALPRGDPRRVGWPKDVGEGRGKSPEQVHGHGQFSVPLWALQKENLG